MRVFAAVHQKPNSGSGTTKTDKVWAIVEAVVVTFILTIIPSLIDLGRPPTCIEDVWVPILSSFLMAAYTYARLRGIDSE